jgi:hypothetical protein
MRGQIGALLTDEQRDKFSQHRERHHGKHDH